MKDRYIILIVVTLFLNCFGCASLSGPKYPPNNISDCRGDKNCIMVLAKSGDIKAIKSVAFVPDFLGGYKYSRIRDPEMLSLIIKAAEKGDHDSLSEVIKVFSGQTTNYPRNEKKLMHFIDIGVANDHLPSLLSKAAYIQDVDPKGSLELYIRAANKDSCIAQLMSAYFYNSGTGTDVNEAKAYFLTLMAQRDRAFVSNGFYPEPYLGERVNKISCNWPVNEYSNLDKNTLCRLLCDKNIKNRKWYENKPYTDEVQELFFVWRQGHGIPSELDKYAGYKTKNVLTMKSENTKLDKKESYNKNEKHWSPLSRNKFRRNNDILSQNALYENISKSVYVIMAAPSMADLNLKNNISQGSAVAVNENTLVTNCHIFESRPTKILFVEDEAIPIKSLSYNIEFDTCIVSVTKNILNPIKYIRSYNSIKIGENVFAIGSPKGLRNSMSSGIVSQFREKDGQKLIQFTSQISGGSSGGGLFDSNGNLIGITTFKVRDSEGLNFAISIDEYFE